MLCIVFVRGENEKLKNLLLLVCDVWVKFIC